MPEASAGRGKEVRVHSAGGSRERSRALNTRAGDPFHESASDDRFGLSEHVHGTAEIGHRLRMCDVASQTVERPVLLRLEEKIAPTIDGRPALPLADHCIRNDRHAGVGVVGKDLVEFFGPDGCLFVSREELQLRRERVPGLAENCYADGKTVAAADR